jgi:hypothetical protein
MNVCRTRSWFATNTVPPEAISIAAGSQASASAMNGADPKDETAAADAAAGAAAADLFANEEAAAHLEAAIALGHDDVSGSQLRLAEVRTRSGDYRGAAAA